MNGIVILTSLLACVWLSWYITRRFVLFAMEQQLLDVPNARSSHSVVTPRGGGVSFVIVTLGSSLVLLLLRHVAFQPGIALLSGGAIAFIGYLDDRHSVSIKSRLLVQFCGSAIAIYCLLGFPSEVPLPHRLLLFAGFLLATLSYTWLINFVNFMDGIDGLAASEAVCVASICCALTAIHSGFHLTALLFGVFAGAVLGFLVWNWHPAHIFMGDAGSGFIGYTLGALALFAATRHELSIWVPIILLGVFAIDATMTLANRMLRHEKWYKPHRLHAFQHASQVFGHSNVTAAVIAINLLWLAPFAFLAQTHPHLGPVFLIAAWSPLVLLMYLFHAGEVLIAGAIPRWRSAYLILNGDNNLAGSRVLDLVRRQLNTYMSVYRALLVAIASLVCTYIAILSDREDGLRLNTPNLLAFAGVFSIGQILSLIAFELHRCHWHLLSIEEVPNIVGMSLTSTLFAVLGAAAITGIPLSIIPRSEFVLQALLLVAAVVVLQLLAVGLSRFHHIDATQANATRVVIYGVNAAGVGISSDLRRLGTRYRIVGFVDPNKDMRGIQVAGGHVLGAHDDIRKLVDTYRVDQVLISSTAMHSSSTQSFVRRCRSESVDFRIIPSIESGYKAKSEEKQPPAAA